AFTEATLPGNEKGLYVGVVIRPKIGWQMAAYADFYQSPFLKYRVSGPSRGWDYLVQLTHTPNRQSEIYLRYRIENKPINEADAGTVLHFPPDKPKQNLRLHFSSRVSSLLTVKARVEMVWINRQKASGEEGFLSFLELSSGALGKWRGNVRLQYFETDSYDSRIYAYESDVLYSYTIPAFFEKGFRYYLNISFESTKRLQFWVRLAQTVFPDRNSIGSGLDEIQGNRRTEVRLQLKFLL
ncbi:MAG TPA: hypothetical protein VMR70_10900, partial [Flavisolibacter sp.]|nr:hypothetical protein [Flavisolibacter sp.]